MESINNLKKTASNVIWGSENNQEPISGETGNVSKGEPYDAGNMGEPSEAKARYTAPDETGTAPVETQTAAQPSETNTQPELSANPSEMKDSSAVPGDSTKGQNDVRSPDDPETHHENAAPKENVDDSTNGLDVGDNPDKLDGPGPRPLEEIARENHGDAGQSGSHVNVGDEAEGAAPPLERHDSGTGELYIKSTGFKADGGDFDAAAAGAGREADRLLDQEGIHKEAPNSGLVANDDAEADGHANGDANGSATKEKTSLKDKIKAKLHRHSETASA